MIITAIPGRTSAKIVIDADHPTPLVPNSQVPVNVRLGYGNLHGPYSTSDSSRMAQLPYQVALVASTSMACDLFAPVELHEENDMHRLFLGQLKQSDPDWSLVEGDGGNQLLLRPSLYSATARPIALPTGRSMTDFTVTHLATGFEFHVLNTHFYADDNGTSRDKERLAQTKFVTQYAAGLKYVIVTGDFNFQADSIVQLRGIFAQAGLLGAQTRQPGLPNGDRDSLSGSTSGRWRDDILTRTDQTVTDAAGVVVGQASDHYLWVRATVGFLVESATPSVRISLFRESDEGRVPVPGVQGVLAKTTVITDHTVPLNRDVVYAAVLSDGTSVVAPSVRLTAALPLLTHPVTGETAACIIQTWPSRSRETPSTVVKIPGRRSPIVLTDVEAMPSSSPVLLTRSREEELEVDGLAATGDVLLLRTLYPTMPDAYLAISGREVSRVAEFKGTSPDRLHTLTAQEIGPEDMSEAGLGDTLGDIARALPSGTLGDLAALFPGGTLLDIAANDWSGFGYGPSTLVPTTPPTVSGAVPSLVTANV